MAVNKKTELVIERAFDPRTCRHTVNGDVCVLHCHHYASLYCQLADDCGMLDGKALLADCAEETFYAVLCEYFKKHGVDKITDRISIAEQYYATVGLGSLTVDCAGPLAGEVTLNASHIDTGWIKKWGQRQEPVNFVTQGYVAALFSAVFSRAARSFAVTEIASIVSGADKSKFQIVGR